MGNVVLDLLEARRPALFIEPDFDFGEVEIQGALGKTFFAEQRRQLPGCADALPELRGHFQGHGF